MKITELEIKGQRIIVTGPTAVYLKNRGKVIRTPNGSTVAVIRYYDKKDNPQGGFKLSHQMREIFDIRACSEHTTKI